MKIIPTSRIHHYVARVGIFLVTAALIVGMGGCNGAVSYMLTITSTSGGSVAEPGEGTFTYDEGTVVNLVAAVAETEPAYDFVGWTGDVNTIADVSAAATTITMNDHYSITANFALPIEIRDWCDLDAARDNPSGFYLLINDLDSTTAGYTKLASPTANNGTGWEPIGTLFDNPFTGTCDGQGYEIRDLFINRPDKDEFDVGLFGSVDVGGSIKNLGVVNADVTGYFYVGGLVGVNWGTVSNSYSSGNVTGDHSVGGLVGDSTGTVSNSYSTGSVTGNFFAGGLVGGNGGGGVDSTATASDSYPTGNVTGNGGLVSDLTGFHSGTVSNSYATGNVAGDHSVGGLVGLNRKEGTISNSYSSGNVTGNEYVGGLVGQNHGGTVSASFWDTQTSGQSTSDGGTGKNTTEMQDITTFSGAGWDIIAVVNSGTRNPSYIWNIVDTVTYPFLSWES